MSSPARVKALATAVCVGDLKKVRLLLKSGVPADGADETGDAFVVLAARFAQTEVFDLLLEAGADVNTPELLEWAVDGDGGRRPISMAIVNRVLGEASHTPDTLNAALRIACVSGDLSVVKALLARGADPSAEDPEFGDTALGNAVENGHHAIAALIQG